MRVLIVEDESRLAMLIRRALVEEGHAVDVVGDGESALTWSASASYDVVVLDVMLPGIDGIAVCRALRTRRDYTPVLLLTARDTVADRVRGLDAGADDYLTKPFALMELAARLRALARRPRVAVDTVITIGGLRLDSARRQLWRGEREIALPNKEFRILEYLLRNPNRVMTRDMIANHVWDYDFVNATNVIDVHIRQLRRKLDVDGQPSLIETVRGLGYRLVQTP
jgi:DNA-binding response OmpR family regulator